MSPVQTLIASFHDVIAFYTAGDGERMVIINDPIPGKVDYTLPVMEAAKRIMNYKRMMKRIRKSRN